MINDIQMAALLVGQEVVVCGNDEVKDHMYQFAPDLNIRTMGRLHVPSKTPPMPIVATPVEDNTPQSFRFALMLKSITPKD